MIEAKAIAVNGLLSPDRIRHTLETELGEKFISDGCNQTRLQFVLATTMAVPGVFYGALHPPVKPPATPLQNAADIVVPTTRLRQSLCIA